MGFDKSISLLPWHSYNAASTTARDFLRNAEDKGYFIGLAAENGNGPNKNLIAFSNEGGIWKSGVSIQHARFQRNSLYLAAFRAEKPRSSYEEIKSVIKDIRVGKKVVEINGFDNFYEFSHIYKQLIQKELERWQLQDTLTGAFIWPNAGKNEVSSEKMKLIMDQIHNEVCINNSIALVQLNIKGFKPHAWLITEMNKTDDGYAFKYLDSNTTELRNPENGFYKEGDTSLKIYGVKCVPYLRYKSDMVYIFKAIYSYITSWDGQESFSNLQFHYL